VKVIVVSGNLEPGAGSGDDRVGVKFLQKPYMLD
jgi:hypothetical protein